MHLESLCTIYWLASYRKESQSQLQSRNKSQVWMGHNSYRIFSVSDRCLSDPCLWGAKCTSVGPNGYYCDCPDQFEGGSCTDAVNLGMRAHLRSSWLLRVFEWLLRVQQMVDKGYSDSFYIFRWLLRGIPVVAMEYPDVLLIGIQVVDKDYPCGYFNLPWNGKHNLWKGAILSSLRRLISLLNS